MDKEKNEKSGRDRVEKQTKQTKMKDKWIRLRKRKGGLQGKNEERKKDK